MSDAPEPDPKMRDAAPGPRLVTVSNAEPAGHAQPQPAGEEAPQVSRGQFRLVLVLLLLAVVGLLVQRGRIEGLYGELAGLEARVEGLSGKLAAADAELAAYDAQLGQVRGSVRRLLHDLTVLDGLVQQDAMDLPAPEAAEAP